MEPRDPFPSCRIPSIEEPSRRRLGGFQETASNAACGADALHGSRATTAVTSDMTISPGHWVAQSSAAPEIVWNVVPLRSLRRGGQASAVPEPLADKLSVAIDFGEGAVAPCTCHQPGAAS